MIISKVYLANRGDCCGDQLTNVMVRTRDIQSDKSNVLKHAFLNIVLERWVLEGCISHVFGLLYRLDASHNTLEYCIGGMHFFTIH